MADHMNRADPSRFSHAIPTGSRPPGCGAARAAGTAYPLETRNRVEPNMSGRHTCWCSKVTVALWASAAIVLTLKKRVPGNWMGAGTPAPRAAPPGPPAPPLRSRRSVLGVGRGGGQGGSLDLDELGTRRGREQQRTD